MRYSKGKGKAALWKKISGKAGAHAEDWKKIDRRMAARKIKNPYWR